MINLRKIGPFKPKRLTSLLGLALDGSRLDGVVLRRVNGSVQVQQTLSVTLSLDPLTGDPELVGREIRNHLTAAGVRERHCVVCLPLKWALVTHTTLPAELPEAEVPGLLQIEAERGFPCDVATLMLTTSRFQVPGSPAHVTLLGVPRNQVEPLDRVLRAAQLRPLSFSLGLCALQPANTEAANGVLALTIGESYVGLQVTGGGGLAALRSLEGAVETEGSTRVVHADLVAREVRITLGQLPEQFRSTLRRVRIFGPRELAESLADEVELRLQPLGMSVEVVTGYPAGEFGVTLPAGTAVSPAFSLAAARLVDRPAQFEFLPPRITAWQRLVARYSSGTLQRVGVSAGAAAALVVGLFGFQQVQIWRFNSHWARISPQVHEIEDAQQHIRQFRSWTDHARTLRSLTVLRQLTQAFPEDGSVTAKTIEIREEAAVRCTGTASDQAALLRVVDKLRAASHVNDPHVDLISGKPPMQFTFDFHWSEGGSNEN
ncbi:MAG: hypothetical protein ABSC03_08220 [Verrucomicrobiota bacterium]|jgi:hypothetical protein